FEKLDAEELRVLEPGLEGRFAAGLYYPAEAHLAPTEAMSFLLDAVRAAGVEVAFASTWAGGSSPERTVIDCRGLAARGELAGLRGVRGERVIVRVRDVDLARPVRLL